MKIRLIGSVVWQFASCCASYVLKVILGFDIFFCDIQCWFQRLFLGGLTSIFMSLCELKKSWELHLAIPVLKFQATADIRFCVHLRASPGPPRCHLHLHLQSNATFWSADLLALKRIVRNLKMPCLEDDFDPFLESLSWQVQTINFNYSVDVADIVNLMSFFWPITSHLSSLFVSSTRSHPNKKRLRNSWLPSPKMVSCSNEIRRCFGWGPGNNLFPTSHPAKTHSGRIFVGLSWAVGQPTAP